MYGACYNLGLAHCTYLHPDYSSNQTWHEKNHPPMWASIVRLPVSSVLGEQEATVTFEINADGLYSYNDLRNPVVTEAKY